MTDIKTIMTSLLWTVLTAKKKERKSFAKYISTSEKNPDEIAVQSLYNIVD